MTNTLCSVFSSNVILNSKLFNHLGNSNYQIGYIGTTETKLVDFLSARKESKHIIFHQPDYLNNKILNPMKLRFHAQVFVVLVCNNFQPAFSSVFQKFLFAGIINTAEVNQIQINEVIDAVIKLGYFPNHHIDTKHWDNICHLPKPKPLPNLTKQEHNTLQLLCNGYTPTQVQNKMKIGKTRTSTIIKNLKQKMACTSIIEITNIAQLNKWITITPETYVRKHPFISNS